MAEKHLQTDEQKSTERQKITVEQQMYKQTNKQIEKQIDKQTGKQKTTVRLNH